MSIVCDVNNILFSMILLIFFNNLRSMIINNNIIVVFQSINLVLFNNLRDEVTCLQPPGVMNSLTNKKYTFDIPVYRVTYRFFLAV